MTYDIILNRKKIWISLLLHHLANQYRKLFHNQKRETLSCYDRYTMITSIRYNWTNEKKLNNRIDQNWKDKWRRFKNADWISSNEKVSFYDKLLSAKS
jgi:hypothetical protein